jgi:hypothetical protein
VTNTEQPTDPFTFWTSLYGTNMELWAEGMAKMFQAESFRKALTAYLDNYWLSSASFRKASDQYMDMWLASMKLPSRDDLAQIDERLDLMAAKMGTTGTGEVDGDAATAGASAMQEAVSARMQAMEQRMQTLETRLDQVLHLLNEHTAVPHQAAPSDAPAADAQAVEAQMQALDAKATQLLELIHGLHTSGEHSEHGG